MINIDDKTRRLSQATIVVGYKQENKAESIEFKIPDYLKEYGKKICFKTKDGKVFSKLFDNTTSNIFTFTRTETQYGELDAIIEFFKTENEDMIIYKTSMLQIIFNESIICEDEVQPDEPKIPILESLIETVTELNNTITENEETRNNNENTRISNEDSRIANETQRDIYYTGIQNKVNNGEFNGATFTPSVDKDGNISWTNNKGLENPTSQNIRGPQGIQGPQGEAFKIKKTYPSIEAMQNDFDNMEVGDYAMIVTSIELEDNAKLYSRTETEWVFITDFSGATGIQGEQGPQGIQGIQGERGIGISKLEVIDGSLWVTLTDSTTQNAGLIITDEVKQWLVNEITNNAESTFNQYYDTKVSEFNENVQAKLDEYNANAEALANKVVELETENTSLKNQIPSGEATGNPIHLSDSSDMECEIVVKGNAEQETRSGKNKLKLEDTSKTFNGVNAAISNELISIKGTSTANTVGLIIPVNMTYKANQEYTLATIVEGSSSSKTNALLLGISSKPNLTEVPIKPGKNIKNYIFEEDTSIENLYFYIAAAGVTVDLTVKLMILEGTYTTDTLPDYEPYGASPSPEFSSEVKTIKDKINIDVVNKNLINSKGFIGKTVSNVKNWLISNFKLIPDVELRTKIVLENNYTPPNKWYDQLQFVKSDMNTLVKSVGTNQTFTLSKEELQQIKYIKYFYNNGGDIGNKIITSLKIEVGNKELDNTYTQHQSQTKVLSIQQEMCKIGDYEDTFVKVDGKWYEQHNIKKLVLDGTESWIYYNSGTFGVFYSDIVSVKLNTNNYLCTHFTKGNYTTTNNVILFTNSGRLHIRNDNISNATDFKSWLAEQYNAGTPVIVYYILETPELIPCTAKQESILNSFYTYKGVTNISMIGIGTLKVNYKKDLETLFNNIIKQIPSSTSDTTET